MLLQVATATTSRRGEGHVTETPPTDAMATGQLPTTSRAGSGMAAPGSEEQNSRGHTPDSTLRPTSASSVHSNGELKGLSSKESCLNVNGRYESNGGQRKQPTTVSKTFSYAQALKTSFSKSDTSTSCSKISSRSETPSDSSFQTIDVSTDRNNSRSSSQASAAKPESPSIWEESGSKADFESGRVSVASSKSVSSSQMFEEMSEASESHEVAPVSNEQTSSVVETEQLEDEEEELEEEMTLKNSELISEEEETSERKVSLEGDSNIREEEQVETSEQQTEVVSDKTTQPTSAIPVQTLPAKVESDVRVAEPTPVVTSSTAKSTEVAPPLFKSPPGMTLNEAHLPLAPPLRQQKELAAQIAHSKLSHPPPHPAKSSMVHGRGVPMGVHSIPHSTKQGKIPTDTPHPTYIPAYKHMQQPLLRHPPLISQPPRALTVQQQQQLIALLKATALQQNLLQHQAIVAAAQGKRAQLERFEAANPVSLHHPSPESPRTAGGFSPVHQGHLKNQSLSHGVGNQVKNTSAFSPYPKHLVPGHHHPALNQQLPQAHFPGTVMEQNVGVKQEPSPLLNHDGQEPTTESSKSRLSIKATPFVPTSQPSPSSGSAHSSPPNSMPPQVPVTTNISSQHPGHIASQVSRPPGFEHTSARPQNIQFLYQHHPNMQIRPVNFPTVPPLVGPPHLPIPAPHAMQQHLLAASQQVSPHSVAAAVAAAAAQRKTSLPQGVPLPESHAFQVITPQSEQGKGHLPPTVRRQLSGEAGLPPGLKDSHSRTPMQPLIGEQSIPLGSYPVRTHLPHYATNQPPPNILKVAAASSNVTGKRALLPTPTGAALLPHGPPVAPSTMPSWAGAMRVPRITSAPTPVVGVSFPQEQQQPHRTTSLYNTGFSAGQF